MLAYVTVPDYIARVFAAERWARSFANSVPDALVLAVVIIAAVLMFVAYGRRRREPRDAHDDGEVVAKREWPEKAKR